jgi:hypothetical protein
LSSARLICTRQRDHPRSPFVSSFAECTRSHSTKLTSLLSAKATTLGKEDLLVPMCTFYTECYDLDTRQSTSLSRVTLGKVTRIPLFISFCYSSKQTKDISHNHHIYHSYHIIITYIIETTYFTKKHKSHKFFTNMSMFISRFTNISITQL